jgi:hypothetical protein
MARASCGLLGRWRVLLFCTRCAAARALPVMRSAQPATVSTERMLCVCLVSDGGESVTQAAARWSSNTGVHG